LDEKGTWFVPILERLLARQSLDREAMRTVMLGLLTGMCGPAETAALLIALRLKGETAEEIAAAAEVLREQMIPLDSGCDNVLDTCGTGGDGTGTFNISTATAFVVAGCGVPVVKHGNRAISGKSGSADVMAELGVRVQSDPVWARRCLDQTGLAFCLAPAFHPGMRHVGPVRQALRVRTLFNCLGPLANPARAPYQLLGVGRPEWLDLLAAALARLGVRRALLVSGSDGLDEVTLSGTTQVREVCEARVNGWEWTANDFGLAPCLLADLQVGGPAESASMIRQALSDSNSPAGRVVIANTAAALVAAERVDTLTEGVRRARLAINDRSAERVLEALIALSR